MRKNLKIFILNIVLSVFIFGCRDSSGDALLQYINMQDLLKPSQINPEDYEDAFFDDFNGKDLDYSKWSKCDNEERQSHLSNHGWWMNECAYVENGNLVLECKKAEDGRLFSGGIRSKGKFERTKGLYEIKFKVEDGSGFWYAFWIFAKNKPENISGSASNGAELDCFEILPGMDKMMSTIHWDAYGSEHKQKGTEPKYLSSSFYNSWHIFQFEWSDNSYICYLDGARLWEMNGSDYGNGMCQVPGYMKITTEFGKEFGGPLDSLIENGGTKKMLVDYVKFSTRK